MKSRILLFVLTAALFAACTQAAMKPEEFGKETELLEDIEEVQIKEMEELADSITGTLAAIDSTGCFSESDLSDLEEMVSKLTETLESVRAQVANLISGSGGASDSTLEAKIAEIQKQLDALEAQIEALRKQIEDLKENFSHLEDIVGDLTTISYISSGADNTATVRYRVDTLVCVPDTLSLNFDLYSEDAANAVVDQWKSALSVKAVYTGTKATAGDIVNLEVVGASASNGILSVRIWPHDLALSFIDGGLDVQISLVISFGKKKVASEYIRLFSEVDGDFCNVIMYYDLKEFDANKNGILTDEELTAITELHFNFDFSSIDWLLCKTPNLEKLTVSNNYSLKGLDLSNNCKNLKELKLLDTRITELDVAGLANLKAITLPSGMHRLNFEDCATLSEFNSADIHVLDLTVDDSFYDGVNYYPDDDGTLIISSGIEQISFSGTPFTSLSVKVNGTLPEIDAKQLKRLAVRGSLKELDMDALDFCFLETLKCQELGLECLNVHPSRFLKKLWCDGNNLTTLDLTQCLSLEGLYCSDNQLTNLDVSKNTNLTFLFCNRNKLSIFDVSKNSGLQELDCSNNQLTSLDVSKNANLTSLFCDSNKLSIFDVSKNSRLQQLGCGYNQLISLDVSNTPALIYLYCPGNQLKNLDVSNHPVLNALSCSNFDIDNQLTWLDISNDISLEYLNLSARNVKLIVTKGLKPSIYEIGRYVSIDGVTGIVYQTTSPGIVSTDETSIAWGCYETNTGAISEDDGVVNTDKIVVGSSAAQWCRAKGSGWYLPSLNELQEIYCNKSTLEETLSSIGESSFGLDWYWSSTELNSTNAFSVNFNNGNADNYYKDDLACVRAVRKL